MPNDIGSNYGGNGYGYGGGYGGYGTPTADRESEAEQIADKTEQDTIKNGWRSAQMKNVSDVIRASKGQ